jgi:hypothetical protein
LSSAGARSYQDLPNKDLQHQLLQQKRRQQSPQLSLAKFGLSTLAPAAVVGSHSDLCLLGIYEAGFAVAVTQKHANLKKEI